MLQYDSSPAPDLRYLDALSVKGQGIMGSDCEAAVTGLTNALVVGLGGIGISTVCNLKSSLQKQFGRVPVANIRFLAIDTDMHCLQKHLNTGMLTSGETCLLFDPRLSAMTCQPKDLLPAAIREITPPDFHPILEGNGAGQIRLAGRLSLMEPDIYRRVVTALTGAISSLTGKRLEIHIIAGVGGGTGSSLCLDIPYLIRKLVHSLGLPDTDFRIFGHIYLPDVYPVYTASQRHQNYANGYAALKEIDYYMNIREIGETFDALYPDGPYSCGENIFDLCALLGGTPSPDDPRSTAISTCVDNLLGLILRPRDTSIVTVMGNDKYYTIGTASLRLPDSAVSEYVIGSVYQMLNERLKENAQSVRQEQVEAFARGVMDPLSLIKPFLETFDRKMGQILEGLEWNKDILSDRRINTAMNAAMYEIMSDFDEDWMARAQDVVKEKAAGIFRDPSKGPYYLARLLTGAEELTGFYQILDGYADACTIRLMELRDTMTQGRMKKEHLSDEMRKFGRFRPNLEDFKGLIRHIYHDEFSIMLLEKLNKTYYLNRRASLELRDFLNRECLFYVDVMSRTGEILLENAAICREELFTDNVPGSLFSLPGKIMEPLKAGIRAVVTGAVQSFGPRELEALSTDFLQGILSVPAGNVNALRSLLLRSPRLQTVTRMTFAHCFEHIYAARTPGEKEEVIRHIAGYLSAHSAPMFHGLPHHGAAQDYQFLSIPEHISHLFNGDQLPGNQSSMPSISSRMLFGYHIYPHLPLWIHEDLPTWEAHYSATNYPGLHIHEGPGMDPPYSDYPPLIPMEQRPREEQYCRRLEGDIQKALAAGILRQGDGGYVAEFLSRPPEEQELADIISKNSGKDLRAAMKAAYGYETVKIPCGDLCPLLRRRMKLTARLRKELAFMEEKASPA